MNVTWYEKGIEKGIEKGVEKGRLGVLELVTAILEERFRPLPPEIPEKLNRLTMKDLTDLGKRINKAVALRDLGLED